MPTEHANFKQVFSYISELLVSHDCVIIPGLGAFVGEPVPASFRDETLIPPHKQISFNTGIRSNDGILAAYIGRRENISYTEANRRLSEFISLVKDHLEKGQHIHFKNTGTLYFTRERNIKFKADTTNLLKSSYGLPVLHDVKPRATATQSGTLHVSDHQHSSWRNWMYAPLALAVIAGTIIGLEFNNIHIANLWNRNPSIVHPPVNTPHKEPAPVQPSRPAVLSGNTPGNARFFIVAGCFTDRVIADEKVSELRSRGYDASVIGMRKGLIAVAYRGYASKADALSNLTEIQDKEDPAAWVTRK